MSRQVHGQSGVHDISRARIIQALRALHRPHEVYEACGHNHALNDPDAFEIEGLGMVCANGLSVVVCQHCCTEMVDNTRVLRDECLDEHKHLSGTSLCPTLAIIEGHDTPWRP